MTDRDNASGYGLLYPFVREHGDFAAASGPSLTRSRVKKILSVRAAGFRGRIGGEYPWRKNFGSFLQLLRHANLNAPGMKRDLATVYATDAIEKWEPAVAVRTERTSLSTYDSAPRAALLRLYFQPVDEMNPSVGLAPDGSDYVEVKQ